MVDILSIPYKYLLAITCFISILILAIILLICLAYGKRLIKIFTNYSISFLQKKFLYLCYILLLNISMISIVFIFVGEKYITFILVGLKSKDIITAFVQTMYFICSLFLKKSKKLIVENSNIVSIIPVYSEGFDQINQTIKSIGENDLYSNKNLICVICDGLPTEIEKTLTEIIKIEKYDYISWKLIKNKIDVIYGKINEIPCIIIKKLINQGKRDTLIIGHDIFNYSRKNISSENLLMRQQIRLSVTDLYMLDEFQYMFCTDADSIISKNSFIDLIETIENRNAIACCGLVVIDFTESQWGYWTIYQNFQYLYGQYIRRGTENLIGKVTCLPGCITMFKIDKCASDAIAMYSDLPNTDDLIKTTVQLLGTDRRLTCSFMFQNSKIKTVYDIRAKCYTIPPNELYPYISQRRRWASNSYFNTLCMIIGPNVHIITRIFGVLDYLRLSLIYFRLFNTIFFVYYLTNGVSIEKIYPFLCIVLYPSMSFFLYSLFDPFLRAMYFKLLLGYIYNKIGAPFVSIMIISNLYWNIGSTKWGGNQKEVV